MKITLFIVSIFCTLNFIQAQSPYVYHTTEGNHYGQRIHRTADGGYLHYAVQYCYTPGVLVIEGCTNAILLQRLNSAKEVLWTNELDYPGVGNGGIRIYEHNDGTFTLLAGENGNNVCNGILAGFSYFSHLLITRLDDLGNEISSTIFPEECEQEFRDAVQLDDDRFAVLSYYDEFGSTNPDSEGRLSIMDRDGIILNEITFPNNRLNESRIFANDNGTLQMLYFEYPGTFHLHNYDADLNLLSTNSTNTFESVYGMSGAKRTSIERLEEGGWLFLTNFLHEEMDNTYFFRFDASLELMAEAVYTMDSPTNMIQSIDFSDRYFVAAARENADQSLDVEIFQVADDGALSTELVIAADGDQRPVFLLKDYEEIYSLSGSVNCCNEPADIGPGFSFLYLGYSTVDAKEPSNYEHKFQFTPTLISDVAHLEVLDEELLKESMQIFLYDATGKLMLSQEIKDRKTDFTLQTWSTGVYFYSIHLKDKVIKNGKLIKA